MTVERPPLRPRLVHEAPGRPIRLVVREYEHVLDDEAAAQILVDLARRFAVSRAGALDTIVVGLGSCWDTVNTLQALGLIEDFARALRLNGSVKGK